MQQFIEKFGDEILGSISGFDRLVFRGSLRRLNHVRWNFDLQAKEAKGMEEYLWQNQILFQNYYDHMRSISQRLKQENLKPFLEQGLKPIFLQDPKANKEALARAVAEQRKIRSGLVCAISAMEPSPTFEHRGRSIIRRIRPCHVLYHYRIHPEVGWMHARIQTWFPFNIQIALNGREWLSRQLDQERIGYAKQDNCLVWIEDWARAQELMNEQLKMGWADWLEGMAKELNPLHAEIFQKFPASYYWTSYQSEWATDVVFRKESFLKRLMPLLVRQAVLGFNCSDVMRYFGRRVNLSGEIPARFNGTLQSDQKRRPEGDRVKYRMNGNSAKFYDKAYTPMGSVLRAAETTITTVKDFRAFREEDQKWHPLRQGTADLYRRVEISQHTNERLMNALAGVDDGRRVEELTAAIQQPAFIQQRRVRPLRPWGEDQDLLRAVNQGEFLINGFRNRDLQKLLYQGEAGSRKEQRRRSAAISRKLRMLRAHKIIRKVSRTHRYMVTEAGRQILLAVLTTAQTSLQQLNQLYELQTVA